MKHHISDDFAMLTIFDEETPARALPAVYDSGSDPTFTIYDGVARGMAVLGRFSWWKALLGFKVQPTGNDHTITVDVKLDDVAHNWWLKKHDEEPEEASRLVRHVAIRCQGNVIGGFTVHGEEQRTSCTFSVPSDALHEGGLLMLDFEALPQGIFERRTNKDPLRGIEITKLSITEGAEPQPAQSWLQVGEPDAVATPQGCVITDEQPAVVRIQLTEKPRIAEALNRGVVRRSIGRGMRKAGVIRRAKERDEQQASAEALAQAFPLRSVHPGADGPEPQMRLLPGDILEITFPPRPDGRRRVTFFELECRPAGLPAIGFADRLVFSPDPATP